MEPYEENDNIVELQDEQGETVRFEHLMTVEHKGDLYVMLVAEAANEDYEEGEAVILKIDKDDQGEDCYVTIDDETLLQEVFEKCVAAIEEADDEAPEDDDDEDDDEDDEDDEDD